MGGERPLTEIIFPDLASQILSSPQTQSYQVVMVVLPISAMVTITLFLSLSDINFLNFLHSLILKSALLLVNVKVQSIQ